MKDCKLITVEEWRKRVAAGKDGKELHPIAKVCSFESKLGPIDPATGMHDIHTLISTAAVDRDRDIISQDGWDLTAYKKNPVVLWAHEHWTPPVARSMDVGVNDDGNMFSVDRFTPEDVNPFGSMIYRMAIGRFINAKSVGFTPTEWSYDEERSGYNLLKNELWEHSWVPVPSNPEALIAASACGIDITPLKDWAAHILDSSPDGRQALSWLPRSVVENAWKQANYVDGAPTTVTITGTPADTDSDDSDPDSDAGKKAPVQRDVNDDAADANNQPTEVQIMELDKLIESIASLVKAVEESNATNKALVEQIAKDREVDDSVELDDLVAEVADEVMSSKTGKLPEGKE